MSSKSLRLAELAAPYAGARHDARYVAYFALFNRQEFFEAHEVLEDLWLPLRRQPSGDFYKALIQLAGAFVHLQRHRPVPAAALFRLTLRNLAGFGEIHESLDISALRLRIAGWLHQLEVSHFTVNPLTNQPPWLEPMPSEAPCPTP